MNDTNDTTMRYDSADTTTNDAVLTGDDRHTVQTYLSDALALEKHIAQPLQRQLELDDSATFSEALTIVSTLKSITETHIRNLDEQLEAAGGHAASGVKSMWSQILGAGASLVDGSRKLKVSKNLRDDYTALSLATISYTMLHATALGLGNEEVAILAKRHLEDYAPLIIQISKTMPTVVLQELSIDGENVQVSAAGAAQAGSDAAWKS